MKATHIPLRTLLCLLLLALWAPGSQTVLAARAGPSLRLGHDAQQRLLVSGSGWKANSRIAFSIHLASLATGRELRADSRGRFALAVTRLSLCSAPVFQARSLAGQSTTLHGPPLGCATPANPPIPSLHLLQGRAISVQLERILGTTPRSVTLHLGDQLYLYESGDTHPGYQPQVDEHYLSVLRQGATPARACAQPECGAGFFWQYVAAQVGVTAIDLSPACRSLRPPCMLPDLEITVTVQA